MGDFLPEVVKFWAKAWGGGRLCRQSYRSWYV